MHKACLFLLSLVVFGSAVYAGDKKETENANPNTSTFSFRNIFSSSQEKGVQNNLGTAQSTTPNITAPKTPNIQVSTLAYKDLSEKISSLRRLIYKNGEDLTTLQRRTQKKIEGLEKKLENLTNSAIQAKSAIDAKFKSEVIEMVPHDLGPAVNDLTSQLQALSEKVTTYEGQLQSAATKEEMEELKEDLVKICQAAADLPTVEELVAASKQYADTYFATKDETMQLFVKKNTADQLIVAALKKEIAEVKEQMTTKSNPQGFAREVHVDHRIHALKQKMATKSELESYVTQDDLDAKKFATEAKLEEQGQSILRQANESLQKGLEGVVKEEEGNPVVRQKELDAKALATAKEIREVKASIPSVDDLAKKDYVDQMAKALEEQLESKANKSDLDHYAKQNDLKNYVPLKTHQEALGKLHEKITALETQITSVEKTVQKNC